MNYPKIGDKYILKQDMSFIDVNAYDEGAADLTVDLNSGETVVFSSMGETYDERQKNSLTWVDSAMCFMCTDDEYEFVIPYRNLKELVQAGVLVRAK